MAYTGGSGSSVQSTNRNYWDPNLGFWISPEGNTYNPDEGIWRSPDRALKYINNQWIPDLSGGGGNTNGGSNKAATPFTFGGTPTGSGSAGFNPQAGYGYDLLDRGAAQDTYLTNLKGTIATNMENLQQQHALELAKLKQAAQDNTARVVRDIQHQQDQGTISPQDAAIAKDQAQRAAEFAQTLALNQLQEAHSKEIADAKNAVDKEANRINAAAEAANERKLQAELAANPQDWVAYEFYKRGGASQAVQALTGGGTGTATPAAANVPTGTPQAQGGVGINGQQFQAPPPGYSDANAASLAQGLFNPQKGALYNPNIQGQGALGTTIQAPNTFTRQEAGSLSDSEMQMLSGLLKAGVNVNGKQIALDPTDYFKQAQQGWIPTLNQAQSGTNYQRGQTSDYARYV